MYDGFYGSVHHLYLLYYTLFNNLVQFSSLSIWGLERGLLVPEVALEGPLREAIGPNANIRCCLYRSVFRRLSSYVDILTLRSAISSTTSLRLGRCGEVASGGTATILDVRRTSTILELHLVAFRGSAWSGRDRGRLIGIALQHLSHRAWI